jgi:hypothetical protein
LQIKKYKFLEEKQKTHLNFLLENKLMGLKLSIKAFIDIAKEHYLYCYSFDFLESLLFLFSKNAKSLEVTQAIDRKRGIRKAVKRNAPLIVSP